MTTPVAFDLDRIVLQNGAHSRRGYQSVCFMEAVAWIAGKPHSDHPECVSPVIGAFMRTWNDGMNDADRQMLKPLIPAVLKTAATPEIELQRSYLALDWYCRVSAPAWLRLAGLVAEAEAIEATAPIVDSASATAAQTALDTARQSAGAARSAAGSAAWSAARSAAWSAARSAARSAAESAAESAARSAAWSAAWSAARSAAKDKFHPTVVQLQASAIELVKQMISLSEGQV